MVFSSHVDYTSNFVLQSIIGVLHDSPLFRPLICKCGMNMLLSKHIVIADTLDTQASIHCIYACILSALQTFINVFAQEQGYF